MFYHIAIVFTVVIIERLSVNIYMRIVVLNDVPVTTNAPSVVYGGSLLLLIPPPQQPPRHHGLAHLNL